MTTGVQADNRARILSALRRSLGRRDGDGAEATVAARLTAPQRGPVPDRSAGDHASQAALFADMATQAAAQVVRVDGLAGVPAAVAAYLKAENQPAEVRLAPDAKLKALAWETEPLLTLSDGPARPGDAVSLSAAFAGIAETGTLMLCSGPEGPTTLNFLPETHMVVLRISQIVGPYEDAWDRLRQARGAAGLPRTVNLITGPSRTADIEQTIQLGAHGPRRLCILLVDDGDAET
jgi:L-lactate dehydrogenase complex protein LldG